MIARMGLIAASPGLFYEGWCRMETAYVSSTATMDLCKGRVQKKTRKIVPFRNPSLIMLGSVADEDQNLQFMK